MGVLDKLLNFFSRFFHSFQYASMAFDFVAYSDRETGLAAKMLKGSDGPPGSLGRCFPVPEMLVNISCNMGLA